MLYSLMRECRNYFPVEGAAVSGRIAIEGGVVDLPLLPGQYFLVEGSVLNDGLHQAGEALDDETFTGTVTPLAVPAAFRELADRIKDFVDKQGSPSPFQSESFAGYSYTRATGRNGGQVTWKDAFLDEIRQWRKI